MITKRDFIVVMLLTIVTCGIYWFYYIYVTTGDLNQMAGDDGQTQDPTTVVLLSIVTCGLYSIYWYYKQGNRMQNMGAAQGIRIDENGTSYLMWIILGSILCSIGSWVGMYLFIRNLNKLIDYHNAAVTGV